MDDERQPLLRTGQHGLERSLRPERSPVWSAPKELGAYHESNRPPVVLLAGEVMVKPITGAWFGKRTWRRRFFVLSTESLRPITVASVTSDGGEVNHLPAHAKIESDDEARDFWGGSSNPANPPDKRTLKYGFWLRGARYKVKEGPFDLKLKGGKALKCYRPRWWFAELYDEEVPWNIDDATIGSRLEGGAQSSKYLRAVPMVEDCSGSPLWKHYKHDRPLCPIKKEGHNSYEEIVAKFPGFNGIGGERGGKTAAQELGVFCEEGELQAGDIVRLKSDTTKSRAEGNEVKVYTEDGKRTAGRTKLQWGSRKGKEGKGFLLKAPPSSMKLYLNPTSGKDSLDVDYDGEANLWANALRHLCPTHGTSLELKACGHSPARKILGTFTRGFFGKKKLIL